MFSESIYALLVSISLNIYQPAGKKHIKAPALPCSDGKH